LEGLIAIAANATAVMVALANANDGGRRWPGTVLITASAIAFSLAGLSPRRVKPRTKSARGSQFHSERQ
jgi:hypothetical protein